MTDRESLAKTPNPQAALESNDAAAQLFREIVVEETNQEMDNNSQVLSVANRSRETTPRRSVRRSRSASPASRKRGDRSQENTSRIREWSETIMNPDDKIRDRAYAKPARGRPKKVILAEDHPAEDSENSAL